MHAEQTLSDRLLAQIQRSNIALCVADGHGDMPLVMVNKGFLKLTGYEASDVEGRNCRFLQTPDTPRAQVAAMSDFLRDEAQEDGRFPVLNQRRNGTTFTNLVFMSKLRDGDGGLRYVIASQFDATAAEEAQAIAQNDKLLVGALSDLRQTAGQFGMTLNDSAALIARSISTLARLTVRDE
ncbi:PAS domain-containing protein [Paracoccus tibetensis]|uniref:PAS domain S-box-containing protein n=1 Tax=Paracoccus tibetensis TaxID=336292 RepID=A0A1G5BWJ0_9RHOB|nr:PAS domain-containing protein [Paracoccus tibetensis]SCX94535.1 PAS domain S-box-containing protein [Paracoccus tibetensis]